MAADYGWGYMVTMKEAYGVVIHMLKHHLTLSGLFEFDCWVLGFDMFDGLGEEHTHQRKPNRT
jgi:hypothetical protein